MQQAHAGYNIFGISHQKGMQSNAKFHTHFQYEIFIFYKGKCKYAVGNKIYDLRPGDVLIMDGSQMHRPFVFDDTRFYERSIVQFSSEWIRPVLAALNARNVLERFETEHFAILRGEDAGSIKELEKHIQEIERYIRDYSLDEVDTELKLELVHLLLKINQLLRKTDLVQSTELGDKYAFVQQAVQYIQNHFQDKLTLDDVAEGINISKSYLVHLFKDLTGNTIMDYTMSYRLKQAMHMLMVYPDLKSKEICYRCGFENESHFSRYFKRNTGVSPREFRKRNIYEVQDAAKARTFQMK